MEMIKVMVCSKEVLVIKSKDYGLLLTYNELSRGSGVSRSNLSMLKYNHKDYFIRGVHFVSTEDVADEYIESDININLFTYSTLFTLKGVVELLIHTRKEKSKRFLDEYIGLNINKLNYGWND